ncbi:MAG TPA: amino acid adenylation domain-containing protein [Candidatus Dormibacteraeota bacterium]|nr:amino acid adenylation domain-containing protein [Candidatus Dormibacteraeota bacterium]
MTPARRDLSAMQLSLLYEALLAPGEAVHVGPGTCVLDGALDLPAFARAWRETVARHTLLRTSFDWSDLERPVQLVHDDVQPVLEHHDRVRPDLVEHCRARPFDLGRAPLFRIVTAAAGDRTWCFVAAAEVILDAWSVTAILHETLDAYAALRSGSVPRPRPRPPYERHVERTGDHDLSAAERFWRARLAEPAAGLAAPPGPAVEPGAGDRVPIELDGPTGAALRRLAAAHGCHLSTIVASAWAVVLSRHAGACAVRFGLRTDGRQDGPDGVETVVGPLATTVPLIGVVDENASLAAHLADWRAVEAESGRFAYAPAPMLRRWAEGTAIDTEVAIVDPDGRRAALAAHELVRELLPAPELAPGPDQAIAIRWRDHGGFLAYRSDRVGRRAAGRLAAHLGVLLTRFASAGERPLRDLSMLTEAEGRRVVVEWNRTTREFDARPIHRLVEAQARRAPDAAALEWRGRATSYGELDRAAGRWAASLRSLGVGPETVVGVHRERSPELVAILLGVLRAGGAYLPLDPSHPMERLAYMVRDAGALAVVSSRPEAWRERGVATLRTAGAEGWDGAETPLDALAYVLYTSGSTGVPKGVAISHRSAANLLHWARETLGPDLRRVLATTSIGFDCSVVEVFGTLSAGGTVVLAESLLDAAGAGAGVRLVNGVPSALLELARAGRVPGSVRTVMAGGEAVPAELAETLHRRPHVERVLNVYGPTETTTYATAWPVPPGGDERPAIGRPLPNTAVYLCDAQLRPVPVGVPGELYIGGVGLARGYLGHPDLTAGRFVPDHLGAVPGGRLYRTGDVARYREDGAIEFLGRIDRQVKVRGHRVEPEEVRAALTRHPAVREAVVGAWDDGAGGSLVAYVAGDADPGELRDHVARSLPAFMVPAHVVPVERVPLLPNGKVDWRSLPAPAPRTAPSDQPAAPRTADEAALLAIWRDLLTLEPRGLDEDFFELGGHSLLLMRVQARVRDELGVELPLRILFESRTIRSVGLALAVARNASVPPPGGPEEQGEV